MEVRQAVAAAAPAARRPDLYRGQGRDHLDDRILLEVTGLAAFARRVDADDLGTQLLVADEFEVFCRAPVPVSEDWVLLEAHFPQGTEIPIGDYTLQTFAEEELRALQALPVLDDLPPGSAFPADVLAGAAFLRLRREERPLVRGSRVDVTMRSRPELLHWQPLLVLMLWSSELVRMQAGYEVERGRQVRLVHGAPEIDTRVGATDDDVMIEWDSHCEGHYSVGQGELERFAAFCAWADSRIARALSATKGEGGKRARRLRRSAQHLVRAIHRTYDGEYVPEEESEEVLLHYVIAIESLMADDSILDLSRKVQYRAATLWRTDSTRRQVAEALKRAYGARSSYVHGDEVADKDKVDLGLLRQIAFQTFLRWLILTTADGAPEKLAVALDEATLSDETRRKGVTGPLDAFFASTPPAWVPADTAGTAVEEGTLSVPEREPRPKMASGWGERDSGS
ncbi:hypothetical protein ACIGZJ_05145 [Kitasatospora sp. NPDC052868]|uniref:hypothetical protein n=1 Tax=Kitasatospora sp. NPDC052868 TaxID=3364060 RepID=UPI0037C816AD